MVWMFTRFLFIYSSILAAKLCVWRHYPNFQYGKLRNLSDGVTS